MDQAGILAQGDILHAVQPILDPPVPAFERQQARGWGDLGGEAGEAILHHLFALAVLTPAAPQAEDLGHARPVQVVGQVGGGDQVALLLGTAVAAGALEGLAAVQQGQAPGRRLEEQADVRQHLRLVLLDQQQIVPTRLPHLAAQVALAEEGIAGEHASGPGYAGQQGGGHGQLGLGLVGALCDGLVGQDHAVGVAEGSERGHRATARLERQAPPLCLAIHRHPLQLRLR
jgi:hypothetical protein